MGKDDVGGLRQACFLVGLPARGKSYIVKKLRRYLNWLQYETKVYYFCLSFLFTSWYNINSHTSCCCRFSMWAISVESTKHHKTKCSQQRSLIQTTVKWRIIVIIWHLKYWRIYWIGSRKGGEWLSMMLPIPPLNEGKRMLPSLSPMNDAFVWHMNLAIRYRYLLLNRLRDFPHIKVLILESECNDTKVTWRGEG